jgi:predicted 2-oxoglutarate/Fe(II)-dependent dioxygenase YbiX
VVLDPMLRVLKVFPFTADGADRAAMLAYVEALPPPERHTGAEIQAPVLMLPNIFEPELCRRLVALYEEHGGVESGFMREVGGRTMLASDPKHKRRRDYLIQDMALIDETKARVMRRLVPEIAKVYQFQVTRMERFIVACYAADEDGHFNAHRDNTTKGTAHRRFAVSLNLNDDYDGGELAFPEFGPRRFRPPAGGAVVFSCSLLHQADLVTRGRRYVFLPFLYDEAAAALREKNNAFLDPAIGQYRGG